MNKIFNTEQIRRWDSSTLLAEGISSDRLMERAGETCYEKIKDLVPHGSFTIVCGTGNNGGDGLVLARWLAGAGRKIQVMVTGTGGSADFILNLGRLQQTGVPVVFVGDALPGVEGDVIIDALLGTGISRAVEGRMADLIHAINASGKMVISIDVPSGLIPDVINPTALAVEATHTLTFQVMKRAYLFQESVRYAGQVHVLDIGLTPSFADAEPCNWRWTDNEVVRKLVKPVSPFAHKYQKGHLQVMAGSYGKMGAAVLCCHGAMRGGCGLVTAYVPSCGVQIMQTSIPEVMCAADEGEKYLHSSRPDQRMSALAIGPGIGTQPETVLMLRQWLEEVNIPMVIDADALNIVAQKNMFNKIPKGTVITPHVGEFDRLFGTHEHTAARIETQLRMSVESGVVIVLKGHHTSISLPTGDIYFNSTGNEGMATAGSGDVLTGVIGSLLAQGYSSADAAIVGVYLHGLAGDLVAQQHGMRGMMAGDIAEMISVAWGDVAGRPCPSPTTPALKGEIA